MDRAPKKHHYLPQGYMRGFSGGENKIFVLDKRNDKILERSPKSIAFEENFYTVDTIDIRNSAEVEESLGTIENTCLPIIRKVSNGQQLSRSELADLAMFIAIQYGRTPESKKKMDQVATILLSNNMKSRMVQAYNSRASYEELVSELQQHDPDMDVPSRNEIGEWAVRSGPLAKVSIDRGTFVKVFFENALLIANELLKRKWKIHHSPAQYGFITSDSPIGIELTRELQVGEQPAILLAGVRRYFPLTRTSCLYITEERGDGGIHQIKTTATRLFKINSIIANQGSRFVIAGEIKDLMLLRHH